MDKFYRLVKDHELIMRECKDLALNMFIERKDHKYARQKEDISFDDLLKIFSEYQKSMHWVFIKRTPHENLLGHHVQQEDGTWKKFNIYYEVGGCTLLHPSQRDYFLFIYLTEEDGDALVKKHGLKTLK